VNFISRLLTISEKEIQEKTTQNAQRLFYL